LIPREPGPMDAESTTMPPCYGLRLNEDQRLFPPAPKSPQEYPEQALG
jgi:hypothetical protein